MGETNVKSLSENEKNLVKKVCSKIKSYMMHKKKCTM